MGHRARATLDALVVGGVQHWIRLTDAEKAAGRGSLVQMRHKVGHEVPVMARVLVLRDGLGARIGTGVVFHPAESIDALPHGELGEDSNVGREPEQKWKTGWRRCMRISCEATSRWACCG